MYKSLSSLSFTAGSWCLKLSAKRCGKKQNINLVDGSISMPVILTLIKIDGI